MSIKNFFYYKRRFLYSLKASVHKNHPLRVILIHCISRSNQSILKKISPECSLERLMLKLQYLVHLMQRTDSLEKTLILGKIEGRRRRGWQRIRWLDGITDWMDISLSKLLELLIDREAWHAAVHLVTKSCIWQRLNWTAWSSV